MPRFARRYFVMGLLPYLVVWGLLTIAIGTTFPGYCDFGDGPNCRRPGLAGFLEYANVYPSSRAELLLGLVSLPVVVPIRLFDLPHVKATEAVFFGLLLAPFFAAAVACTTKPNKGRGIVTGMLYLLTIVYFSLAFLSNVWTPTLGKQGVRGFCTPDDNSRCAGV